MTTHPALSVPAVAKVIPRHSLELRARTAFDSYWTV